MTSADTGMDLHMQLGIPHNSIIIEHNMKAKKTDTGRLPG